MRNRATLLVYNTWSAESTDQIIRDNARAMVNSGLANRGWTYINLDEGWGGVRGGRLNAVRGGTRNSRHEGALRLCPRLGNEDVRGPERVSGENRGVVEIGCGCQELRTSLSKSLGTRTR